MKNITSAVILLAAAVIGVVLISQPSSSPAQIQQVPLPLVQQVLQQQATISANQDKIEQVFAEIAEEVRLARIYAKRGGRGLSVSP